MSGRFECRESGIVFLEVLLALALLGIIAIAFLSGLATISKATIITDEQTTAESLAQSQMEWIKNAGYVHGATEYPAAPVPDDQDYLNYSAAIAVSSLHNPDDGIQKIIVTVKHSEKEVTRLATYKVVR